MEEPLNSLSGRSGPPSGESVPSPPLFPPTPRRQRPGHCTVFTRFYSAAQRTQPAAAAPPARPCSSLGAMLLTHADGAASGRRRCRTSDRQVGYGKTHPPRRSSARLTGLGSSLSPMPPPPRRSRRSSARFWTLWSPSPPRGLRLTPGSCWAGWGPAPDWL